jgi:CBS domain containing-hemolysin-like protein
MLPTDGLIMALDAMYHTKQSRAFVVTDKGKPIGVITLEDVCKELIRLEELEKEECHLSMLNANHHYY